jgi:hypothetical protein
LQIKGDSKQKQKRWLFWWRESGYNSHCLSKQRKQILKWNLKAENRRTVQRRAPRGTELTVSKKMEGTRMREALPAVILSHAKRHDKFTEVF